MDVTKLDNELYVARYGKKQTINVNEIWNKIKSNPEVLREAVKITKNKWNKDTVNGLAISDAMLTDFQSVDAVAYNELIKSIYTNTDIARLVVDGYSNGGYSFLLMSLWNHNLRLTDEQKAFAVSEAMNKVGTIKYNQRLEEYSKSLDEHGITDDITTTIDVDGFVTPIGAKTKVEHINSLCATLSNTQAHGREAFDIRYYILRNPNWILEEKKKLIMDFWYDSDAYDDCLDEWEWAIVNDSENYKGNNMPHFDKDELLNEYTYDMLLKFYGNSETTNRIWSEIKFCEQMHKLRPQQWELETVPQKVLN